MPYQDERGIYKLTATTASDDFVMRFNEWVEAEFGGNQSAAIKYAIRSQMQREIER
jgi:hypothetical protein